VKAERESQHHWSTVGSVSALSVNSRVKKLASVDLHIKHSFNARGINHCLQRRSATKDFAGRISKETSKQKTAVGEKDSDWLHISRNRFRRGFLKQQSIISESRASK
jgi:hypothetical protein